jgi:endonuclease/exonuclease/phosphatase family metal-dependent hydrolase
VIFSLTTFNVGLLEIFGGLYQPVPFVAERLRRLPEALLSLGTDVIAVQEIYNPIHRKHLFSALREAYPFYAPTRRDRKFGLQNSLLTLSKIPMSSHLELFRYALPDEKCFDNKGYLVSRLRANDETELLIMNIHATAGGSFFHPESLRTHRVRAKQITQILDRAAEEQNAYVIICGDLNAGPGVSEGNYNQFSECGFVDVHQAVHKSTPEPTWDPKNTLNHKGPHQTSPAQRVDHVFVRREDLNSRKVRVRESTIQSKEECVVVGSGKVTLSDHYSLRVVFEINAD